MIELSIDYWIGGKYRQARGNQVCSLRLDWIDNVNKDLFNECMRLVSEK